jgi:hypothetical protein
MLWKGINERNMTIEFENELMQRTLLERK